MLFQIIGWPGVVGCAFFLVLIPVQLSFTRLFAKFRVKSADVADERVKLMREIIDGIRVIKMYVWEASFAKVIRKLRAQGCYHSKSLEKFFSQFLPKIHIPARVPSFNVSFYLIYKTGVKVAVEKFSIFQDLVIRSLFQ